MKLKIFFLHLTLLLLCFGTAAYAQMPSDDEYYDDYDDSEDAEYYEDDNEDVFSSNRTERVISFHADIVLAKDNYMEVTEHIRIYAKGNIFQHGLRRELRQTRDDQYGHTKSVPVYLQDIRCYGMTTPWHSEEAENGDLVVYIGDADTYLKEGLYEYTIKYIAPGHIGQFDDHDEIFWNLNGFGWNVPFDTLSATVTVPNGTDVKKFFGYVGAYGEKREDYTAQQVGKNKVEFTSTKPVPGGENMSIVVEFSKGSQKPLTWWQIWGDDVLAGCAGLGFILFCLFTWIAKGIDPKKPTVIPQYTVPKEISPALAGRILAEGNQKEEQVVATIMSMVIKGGATINRRSQSDFDMNAGSEEKLDAYEKDVYKKLFSSKTVASTKHDTTEFAKSREVVFQKSYKEYSSKYYIHNAGWLTLATILGLGLFVFLCALSSTEDTFLIVLGVCIVVYLWYLFVIGKYTMDGIQVRSKMEGLKMYINTAEALQMRDLTPEHFEEMLPYAIAFGVENKWCKQFENILKQCKYEPEWYNTSDSALTYSTLLNHGGMHSIASGLKSATHSSFAAYDRAQSSSSGGSWSSGGGGFSGGGGGGGGGGGW